MARQLSARLSQKRLLRNQTSRWRSATRKVRVCYSDSSFPLLSSSWPRNRCRTLCMTSTSQVVQSSVLVFVSHGYTPLVSLSKKKFSLHFNLWIFFKFYYNFSSLTIIEMEGLEYFYSSNKIIKLKKYLAYGKAVSSWQFFFYWIMLRTELKKFFLPEKHWLSWTKLQVF